MKRKNIILVVVDAARIDRVKKSRVFNNLAKNGVFFDEMITASPYTLASMNSFFTSIFGSVNGIDGYNKIGNLNENCKTLMDYLKECGYTTRGDTVRLNLVPSKGFDKLTEHEEINENIKQNNDNLINLHSQIIEELSHDNGSSPFFLYLHYSNIHNSLVNNVLKKYSDFDDEYFANRQQNSDNYDKYFEYAEEYVESINQKLISTNLSDDTILILMSDHGVSLGEKKGERAYGVFTYDYTIKTFAILVNEDLFGNGKLISEITQTIDIMPTLLSLLDIPLDLSKKKIQGKSLLPLLNEKKANFWNIFGNKKFREYAYCETGGLYGPWPSPSGPNVFCVRTHDWKLIYNSYPKTFELYNLKKDPNELNNCYGLGFKEESKLKINLEKELSNLRAESLMIDK